jgi:hypothetical protein
MSETAALERRYRRLLAVYPTRHRRVHAEEMLGVLLSAAADGQRRPRLADAVDLIRGGLRIRARAFLRGPADPHWRDALAVVSVVAPLLLLAAGLAVSDLLGIAIRTIGTGIYETPFWLGYWQNWPTTGGTALLVLLVLLRWRRAAAVTALAVTATPLGLGVWYLGLPLASLSTALFLLLGGLATAALTFSPGPARGLEILGWWRTAAVGAGALVLAALMWGDPFLTWRLPHLAWPLLVLTGVGGVAVASLRAPVGRRVIVLLMAASAPLWLAVFSLAGRPYGVLPEGAALYLPALLVTCAIVAARMSRQRGRPGRGGREHGPPGSGQPAPPEDGGLPAGPAGENPP